MVKSVKSEKDLSKCCVALINTSLSTASLPVDSYCSPQRIRPAPRNVNLNVTPPNNTAVTRPITQDKVVKRIDDEDLPLITPANALLSPPVRSHLSPNNNGSFVSGHFSSSLSSMGYPLCRICHVVHETARNPMVSPCRCSGTMRYVHIGCLVHWLEVSAKKMYPQPQCELCGYFYQRRPCIDLKRVHMPHVNTKDIALNVVFVFALLVMVLCAAMCVHFLRVTDQYHSLRLYRSSSTTMNNEDLTVITCSVLFFVAFFIAVFTQYRAEASIFRVFFRFWLINRNWQISNYDVVDDPQVAAGNATQTEKTDTQTNANLVVMVV